MGKYPMTTVLTPLQNKFLGEFFELTSDFWLTGGTALSAFYLHHRYSEDLDLFTDKEDVFQKRDENNIKKPKKKKSRKKLLIAIGVAVVIFSLIVVNLKKKGSPQDNKGNVVKVEIGGVIDRLTETGTIELVRSVAVKSKISGKVKELLVEEGEPVKAGQKLAIVEPDPNQALMLYGKRAAVDRARIEYLEKQRELERQRELSKKSLISSQELEKMENLYHLALNTYKQALMEQRILEMEMTEASKGSIEDIDPGSITELDDYRIIAPISGILISRNVEVGEMVVTGISSYMVGTTLFQIGDPSEMIVKSSISEVDVGKLKVAQEVEIISDSYPEVVYHGKVKHIAPVGEIKQGASIVTFDTEIEILDPEARLRQGMSCDINIIFDKRDSVLTLPVEAVHEVMIKDLEGEETTQVDSVVAYKWTAEKYQEIRVKLGLESSNKVQVLSGLNKGDEVSLEASKKFKEFRDKEEKEKKKK